MVPLQTVEVTTPCMNSAYLDAKIYARFIHACVDVKHAIHIATAPGTLYNAACLPIDGGRFNGRRNLS